MKMRMFGGLVPDFGGFPWIICFQILFVCIWSFVPFAGHGFRFAKLGALPTLSLIGTLLPLANSSLERHGLETR